jgi:tartrate dehydratase alpha subunit/fumarate hydratase class I-like protein
VKEIYASQIAETVARLCVEATHNLPEDVVASLNEAAEAVKEVASLVKIQRALGADEN